MAGSDRDSGIVRSLGASPSPEGGPLVRGARPEANSGLEAAATYLRGLVEGEGDLQSRIQVAPGSQSAELARLLNRFVADVPKACH